jgi:outer membrane protein OmpA-like peptidoglycan-associated protein
MKSKILALAAAGLMANQALADPEISKHSGEGPGLTIGGVVGAVLGGPVGLAVGGGLGGWLSNKFHKERKTREAYQASYYESEALAEQLDALLASNRDELDDVRLVVREQQQTITEQQESYRGALREALNVQVYFRTGESTLEPEVADRVGRVGRLMRDFDDFSIVVEGHADPRGEADYNDQLSADRAATVRDVLIEAGLPAEMISTRATGESGSLASEGDLDAMAMERRVDLSIVEPLPRENRVAKQ